MLFVDRNYRKKGHGKRLMEHWERDMKAQGYDMLLTSTQVDGEAQPMELFLIKNMQDYLEDCGCDFLKNRENVLPFSSESTLIYPPCLLKISRVRYSPIPTPSTPEACLPR